MCFFFMDVLVCLIGLLSFIAQDIEFNRFRYAEQTLTTKPKFKWHHHLNKIEYTYTRTICVSYLRILFSKLEKIFKALH